MPFANAAFELEKKNKIVCDGNYKAGAASSLLAWNITGWNPPVDEQLRATLKTVCEGKPLRPPGYKSEKAYQANGSRYRTVPQNFFKNDPMLVSCGPKNMQNLFFAELPSCETLDLAEIKNAVEHFASGVRVIEENYDGINKGLNRLLSLVAYEIAGIVWDSKASFLSKRFQPVARMVPRLTSRGGKISKFVFKMGAGVATDLALNPSDVAGKGESFKLLSDDLIDGTLGGDLKAKDALYRELFSWSSEHNGKVNESPKERTKIDEEAFQRVLIFLTKYHHGRKIIQKIKDY